MFKMLYRIDTTRTEVYISPQSKNCFSRRQGGGAMNCPACGDALSEGSLFCESCGVDLRTTGPTVAGPAIARTAIAQQPTNAPSVAALAELGGMLLKSLSMGDK